MYLSVGQAAEVMGISISTLRRWEEEGYLMPCYRTKGNHRRYSLERIERDILKKESDKNFRKAVAYARVSSHDQKNDLKRQEIRLENYCKANNFNHEIISDLGSGLNYNKVGLKKLINLICQKKVSHLILTHKDRLLRFGSPLLFRLCEFFGTKVVILDDKTEQTFEQELAGDVIEIMTVFSAKLYGKRSHKNKKSLQKVA